MQESLRIYGYKVVTGQEIPSGLFVSLCYTISLMAYIMLCFFLSIKATGSRLGTFSQAITSIGTGIVIGLIYSWKLTLLILAFAPPILVGGVLRARMMGESYSSRSKKALGESGKVY